MRKWRKRDDQKRVQRHMSSENNESFDDPNVKDVKEEAEKEVDNDSSADVSIDGGEEENTTYEIWKSNAQYLYDLLIHNHTQWPCLSCSWGPLSEDRSATPLAPLSQVLFTTTHTGRDTSSPMTCRWNVQRLDVSLEKDAGVHHDIHR